MTRGVPRVSARRKAVSEGELSAPRRPIESGRERLGVQASGQGREEQARPSWSTDEREAVQGDLARKARGSRWREAGAAAARGRIQARACRTWGLSPGRG